MTFFRAAHLIPATCKSFSMRIGRRRAGNDLDAVIGYIAGDDKMAGHVYLMRLQKRQ